MKIVIRILVNDNFKFVQIFLMELKFLQFLIRYKVVYSFILIVLLI